MHLGIDSTSLWSRCLWYWSIHSMTACLWWVHGDHFQQNNHSGVSPLSTGRNGPNPCQPNGPSIPDPLTIGDKHLGLSPSLWFHYTCTRPLFFPRIKRIHLALSCFSMSLYTSVCVLTVAPSIHAQTMDHLSKSFKFLWLIQNQNKLSLLNIMTKPQSSVGC